MTYKLPANFTGYNANEIGIERFRTLCYALQNRQLLRVQSIHGYEYPKNYYVVWFGNESRGISELALACSDACIQIEMYGIVESLNLSTSTGIVLYEITKQR